MINEEIIKRIILEKPKYEGQIKRNIEIPNLKKSNKICTIIGPRRAGKTYFMYQIIEQLVNYGTNPSQVLYINFEDDRLEGLEKEDLQKILDIYYELFPENKNEIVHFMFDEIQNAPLWSKFVRRLNDKEKCRLYITGSSSKMLSKEIATELRGRTLVSEIFPFSFLEYISYKGIVFSEKMLYSDDRYKIINYFNEYFKWGGFPETFSFNQDKKLTILQDYYNVVIFRDVVDRHKITNVSIVKEIFKILINNFSRKISVNKLYNDLKSANRSISKDLLYEIISYIEETMYFYFVPIFSDSANVKMINPKKVYCIDNGLINSITTKTDEFGWLYENLVAINLISKNRDLFYNNGEGECDFIIFNKGLKENSAIQVIYELNEDNREREIKGLLEGMDRINAGKGILINKNIDKEEIIKGKKIIYKSLWRWLLEDKI